MADARQALSVDAVASAYSISRRTVYAEIERGKLKATKIGTRTIILLEHIREWLNLPPQPTSLPTFSGHTKEHLDAQPRKRQYNKSRRSKAFRERAHSRA